MFVIDVSDIKYVINFDFPNNTEDYIHRIGRTARAKKTGTAYSFFTKNNAKQAKELIEIIKEAKQPVPPRLYEMVDMAKQMMHMKRKIECMYSYTMYVCHSKLIVCIPDLSYLRYLLAIFTTIILQVK